MTTITKSHEIRLRNRLYLLCTYFGTTHCWFCSLRPEHEIFRLKKYSDLTLIIRGSHLIPLFFSLNKTYIFSNTKTKNLIKIWSIGSSFSHLSGKKWIPWEKDSGSFEAILWWINFQYLHISGTAAQKGLVAWTKTYGSPKKQCLVNMGGVNTPSLALLHNSERNYEPGEFQLWTLFWILANIMVFCW